MQRTLLGLVCVVVMLAVAPAMGDLSKMIRVTANDGLIGPIPGGPSGNAGEFEAHTNGWNSFDRVTQTWNTDFRTFCLEATEFLTLGTWYYVDITTYADDGGEGSGQDPLDPYTAWLYEKYKHLELHDIVEDFDYDVQADAIALQQVIWYIEGEGGTGMDEYTELTALAQDLYDAVDLAAPTDIGNVRVATLWEDAAGTINAQDMLVQIPLPDAALLGLIGLAVIAGVRRRFS